MALKKSVFPGAFSQRPEAKKELFGWVLPFLISSGASMNATHQNSSLMFALYPRTDC
jgi:hypothetical protein